MFQQNKKDMDISNLTLKELDTLMYIGFCQPKFYRPSVWRKAKKLMDTLVEANTGIIAYDFGRGKGKYTINSDISIAKMITIVAERFNVK